jgi:Flp pilus assembly pilin Flp
MLIKVMPTQGVPRGKTRVKQVEPFAGQRHIDFFEEKFMRLLRRLWKEQEGQDIAEYAVMLAVILVIVVGTVRLIGSNANTVFSNVASSIQ